MRWLINTIPTPLLVVLIVGGLVAFGVIGHVLVHRRLPDLDDGEHNDVAGILVGVVGALYGILLAFVIVAVYQNYMEAESNVRAEASAVAQLVRDTRGMSIATAVDRTAGDYVHAVVDDEWPAMSRGELSKRGAADVDMLFTILQGYEPASNSQVYFYEASIADLNQVVVERRSRLFEAEKELPAILDALIFGGAVLLVAFLWLFGMRHKTTQLVMVGGVAALIGFSVLVAVDLDHPFAGQIAVSSSPFDDGILARYWP